MNWGKICAEKKCINIKFYKDNIKFIEEIQDDLIDLYYKTDNILQNTPYHQSFLQSRFDFLYSSFETISPETDIALMGFNPGGGDKELCTNIVLTELLKKNIHRISNAYLDENWKFQESKKKPEINKKFFKKVNPESVEQSLEYPLGFLCLIPQAFFKNVNYNNVGKYDLQQHIKDFFELIFDDKPNDDIRPYNYPLLRKTYATNFFFFNSKSESDFKNDLNPNVQQNLTKIYADFHKKILEYIKPRIVIIFSRIAFEAIESVFKSSNGYKSINCNNLGKYFHNWGANCFEIKFNNSSKPTLFFRIGHFSYYSVKITNPKTMGNFRKNVKNLFSKY